ncbi:methyl-accepting chemotaxis protein [Propionispira arboris]|uniref:Methyl-accepting chemotaxis protein n=1 Tax=Propionispira arboris TaxID=84035 RepID=A0A1H6UVH1_9FIRM|nr:methyl-accepting chemotaxis protein [Propionispira arboris]SEI94634.1 methyl-accepting chemotaxis protein [Propionispira arboris]
MKWFKDMNVGKKVTGAFLILSFIVTILSVMVVYNIYKIDSRYSDLYSNNGLATGYIGEMGMFFNDSRVTYYSIVIEKDYNTNMQNIAKLKDIDTKINDVYNLLVSKSQTDQTKEELRQFKDTLDKYRTLRQGSIDLALQNKNEEALMTFRQAGARQLSEDLNNQLMDLFKVMESTGMKQSDTLTEQAYVMIYTMLAVAIVVIILSLLLGNFIASYIRKAIHALMEAAEKIASGDLDVQIPIDSRDELGHLAQAFDKMSNNVNTAMENINAASEQVAAGSKNVSEASISLSQGATEQASSVEELSSSLEEISAQTKLNANNADKANSLTNTAKTNAGTGNAYMHDMLRAMTEINASSTGISKIIKVIDEIAFQTNILALNAAVEAARAGQHGKGFAVVAEEVRNLAARSAKAAKETTDMIEGSIGKVNEGTKIANQTAEALTQIVQIVTEVAELVEKIASASNEQSIALEQINQGVIQVSEVVQSNSSTAEESASASEQLNAQAELLKETVSQFKLRVNTQAKQNFYSNKDDVTQPPRITKGKHSKKIPSQIALSDDEFGKY